ncbi:MAG: M56 family metallopeptidase [Acidobacteriota bacterium]
MTGWQGLFDAPAARALARALLDFLWQGAAVSGLLALTDLAARRRGAGPRLRYALSCAALAIMVLLPAANFLRRAGARPDSAAPAATASPALDAAAGAAGAGPASAASAMGSLDRFGPASRILLAGWFSGVLVLSLRLLVGWRSTGRLALLGTSPARPEILASAERLARRLTLSKPVRILESAALQVPVALGVLRPAVLLPVSSLTGMPVKQIEALLAHELAHIRRHDYLVNLIQSAAETLLFYHPAVWWVSSRIRVERENCCDDLAVAATGDPMVYARALVELEERRNLGQAGALALAADGGQLFGRVARLFPETARVRHSRPRSRVAGALGLACVVLAAAAARVSPLADDGLDTAAVRISAARPLRQAQPAAAIPALAPVHSALPSAAAAPTEMLPVPAAAGSPASKEDLPVPEVAVAATSPAPASARVPAPAAPAVSPAVPDAVVEAEPAVPEASPALRDDELVSLRRHGVTPEFLREISSLGYRRASTDELIALRVHGVSTEDIAQFQKIFGSVSLRRCIAFRIHGVTPDWIRAISAAGLSRMTAEEAESLRIHSVTPSYLEGFRQAGYGSLTAEQALNLKIHGVQPRDAAAWPGSEGSRPALNELVSARIHGVDARFAGEMREAGFPAAGIEELTAFRIHGIDAAFVQAIKAAGFPSLSADDAVAFRIHAVTPDFLREMHHLGVRTPSAHDATALRIHGVTAEFVRSLAREGYSGLSTDDLTSLRIHGMTAEDIRRLTQDARARLSVDDLLEARFERRSSR